ncbi:NTP transferase domain-containing protein, partial [Candidatus Omnitrophota bacterium]
MKAVILAAGIGKRLRGYFDKPKCLLEINGKSLINAYLHELRRLGVEDTVVVVGYKKDVIIEEVKRLGIPGKVIFVENPDYSKGSILSLCAARKEFNDDIILMDGDVYFESEVLSRIIKSKYADCLLIDRNYKNDGEAMIAGI